MAKCVKEREPRPRPYCVNYWGGSLEAMARGLARYWGVEPPEEKEDTEFSHAELGAWCASNGCEQRLLDFLGAAQEGDPALFLVHFLRSGVFTPEQAAEAFAYRARNGCAIGVGMLVRLARQGKLSPESARALLEGCPPPMPSMSIPHWAGGAWVPLCFYLGGDPLALSGEEWDSFAEYISASGDEVMSSAIKFFVEENAPIPILGLARDCGLSPDRAFSALAQMEGRTADEAYAVAELRKLGGDCDAAALRALRAMYPRPKCPFPPFDRTFWGGVLCYCGAGISMPYPTVDRLPGILSEDEFVRKNVIEFFRTSQDGDPAWAIYCLATAGVLGWEIAFRAIQQIEVGDPPGAIVGLVRDCGLDKERAAEKILRLDVGDPADAIVGLVRDCGLDVERAAYLLGYMTKGRPESALRRLVEDHDLDPEIAVDLIADLDGKEEDNSRANAIFCIARWSGMNRDRAIDALLGLRHGEFFIGRLQQGG